MRRYFLLAVDLFCWGLILFGAGYFFHGLMVAIEAGRIAEVAR